MAERFNKNIQADDQFNTAFNKWFKESGKKQKDAAAFLDMTQGTFNNILHNKRALSLSSMSDIANKLGKDLADMLIEGRAILAGESLGEAPADPVEAVPAPAPSSTTMLDQGRELELLRKIEALTDRLAEKDAILIQLAQALKDKDDKIDRLEFRLASLENAMASKMKGEEAKVRPLTTVGAATTETVDEGRGKN